MCMSDTKNEILIKSLRLFLRKSYKEVTMSEIVKEIGLTKGAIYHHFTNKEEIFEEAVKYFYNHEMITNYNSFPQTSLFDFYNFYLEFLGNSSDSSNEIDKDNVFLFLSEAIRRIPIFLEINENQRNKEINAWSKIIDIAKEKKEIDTDLSSEDIAHMFLNLSDGVALNKMIALKSGTVSLNEMKRDWNNLYALLRIK